MMNSFGIDPFAAWLWRLHEDNWSA